MLLLMRRTIINWSIFSCIIGCFISIGRCQSFLFEDPKICFNIHERILSLKAYALSKNYCWFLEWRVGKHTYSGCLTGKLDGVHHWIKVTFPDKTVLYFDKNDPRRPLYPNILCFLPEEHWQNDLGNLPSVSYELIAMPFLEDEIASVKKTAKQGRKALEIIFHRKGIGHVKLYLDFNFNTILEVQMFFKTSCSKFKLKSLKKFNNIWCLHKADFYAGKESTKLNIKDVEIYDEF